MSSIDGIGARIAGLRIPQPNNEEERPGGNAASGASSRTAPSDSVEISEAGRNLARELPPHLAEIREKVENGAYNTPAAAEETARRILASGDLGQS